MREIRVGMVGCGSFGMFHLSNLQQIEGVRVAALATGNEEKLRAAARRAPGAALYRDHRAMFEQERGLDAVVVSIPPDRHGDLEIMAARRGIAMYIEKPVSVSLEDALRNERAIAEAGVVCSVGYHGRYNPELDVVKARLAGRSPGLVVGKWIYSLPDLNWWRFKARSGGQLVEQATHIFDLFRYLFGEPVSFYSVGRRGLNPPLEGSDTEDCSSTLITFAGGGFATLLAGCYLDTDRAVGDIGFDIYLEDAKLEYGFFTGAEYITRQGRRSVPFEPVCHRLAMEAFIGAVRAHDPAGVRSTYSDAVKTLRATLAARESLERGAVVSLA